MRLEILVEEPSAEAALNVLIPVLVGTSVEYVIRTFRGKTNLLKELPVRLKAYGKYARQSGVRVVVLVDRDEDDCLELKGRICKMAVDAGLNPHDGQNLEPMLLCRIAIEELEAWFFGDVPALVATYPRVPSSLGNRVAYRDPDNIKGGTWEALERVLQQHGYHQAGLPKVAAATSIAQQMNVEENRSHSFRAYRDGVRRVVGPVDA